MEIVTDTACEKSYDLLLEHYGYGPLFRKTDYIIEQPLYRYRSNIDWAASEISTSHIFLSSPDLQNDPFDSTYAVNAETILNEEYPVKLLLECIAAIIGADSSYVTRLWNECSSHPLEETMPVRFFIEQFTNYHALSYIPIQHVLIPQLGTIPRRQVTGYKIACFSESLTSIPMWAYYACNHEGVCLKYDVCKLDPTEDNLILKTAFSKVHYSEYRPKDLHSNSSLITKSSQWAHEHEWRLICRTPENYITVPCLSAVYLGTKFNHNKYYDTIVSAIKSRNDNTELYRCTIDGEKYSLNFHRIHFTPPYSSYKP